MSPDSPFLYAIQWELASSSNGRIPEENPSKSKKEENENSSSERESEKVKNMISNH